MSTDDFVTLCRLIADEGLCIEENGEEFSPEHRVEGQPLRLYDHQAIGGRFDALEAWCEYRSLPFTRTCAGYPGGWRAECVVFTGHGPVKDYPADEEGHVVATSKLLEAHQCISTLRAWFAAAEFEVPPLEVTADGEPSAETRAFAHQKGSGAGNGEPGSPHQKGLFS